MGPRTSRIAVRQRRLYDELWQAAREGALSPDLIRFEVWRPHLRSPIADVGAGDGLLSRSFPDLHVVSVDLSVAGLGNARGPATVAEAERLPLRARSVRTVVISELLEHAADPRLVLEECRRVIVPDGKLLLSTPLWPLAHAERLYHWVQIGQRPTLANLALWDPSHERRYRMDDLVAEVEAAGFDIDETTMLFGSATTMVLYVVEPLLARIRHNGPRLAHRFTGLDRLLRPIDESSDVALACRPR